jgi:hypothetical protein
MCKLKNSIRLKFQIDLQLWKTMMMMMTMSWILIGHGKVFETI